MDAHAGPTAERRGVGVLHAANPTAPLVATQTPDVRRSAAVGAARARAKVGAQGRRRCP